MGATVECLTDGGAIGFEITLSQSFIPLIVLYWLHVHIYRIKENQTAHSAMPRAKPSEHAIVLSYLDTHLLSVF